MGVVASDAQLDDVFERTEGWAEGIRLVGLSMNGRRGETADLSDYVQTECLAALTPGQRAFVRRTSILGRLSPSLCDAVLERDDSVRMVASLEGSHVSLIALDRGRQWFRYHRAVREQLQRELGEQEPSLAPELERRAAAWLEANGEPERALRHACAAGDARNMARLVEVVAPAMHNDGRDDVLLTWIARIERHAELQDFPGVAVLAARLHAQRGSASEADRCLAAAICGATALKRGRVANALAAQIDLVCAAMCGDGVEAMLAAAESAVSVIRPDDCWRPYGLLLEGCAHALLGHGLRADAILARAVHTGRRFGSRETCAVALTQRALVATTHGERIVAGQLLDLAREEIAQGRLDAYPTTALTLAASARLELLHGHSPEAFAALGTARALLPALGRSLPWLAVQARLELAEAEIALRDATAAGALLAEVDELLAGCPRLGLLRRRRDLLAAEIRSMPAGADGRSVGLTAAELRLVPMLATHLSFREIGARFFLSRNTVKTQAISVYRKLGASSRSEAVTRAHGLGLIEVAADDDALIHTG
jgi:LuxR family maltose regulon positive regulatory protein